MIVAHVLQRGAADVARPACRRTDLRQDVGDVPRAQAQLALASELKLIRRVHGEPVDADVSPPAATVPRVRE